MTAIDDKWAANQWLGAPVDEGAGSDEGPLPDGRGRVRDFQNGSIYWTPEHGAHIVLGAIRLKWAEKGGHRGILRYPVSDEVPCGPGDGRFNHFEGGSIYWRADIGPHMVHGPVRDKWASLGWQDGGLGYPLSDVRVSGDTQSGTFQHGTIVWTPSRGAVVAGNID